MSLFNFSTLSEAELSSPIQSDPLRSSPIQSDPLRSSPILSDPVRSSPIQSEFLRSSPNFSDPVRISPIQSGRTSKKKKEPPKKIAERFFLASSVTVVRYGGSFVRSFGAENFCTSFTEITNGFLLNRRPHISSCSFLFLRYR